jgi:hypothetical protein
MITYKGKDFHEVGDLKLLGVEGDDVLCECKCSRKLKRPLQSIHEAIRMGRHASCPTCQKAKRKRNAATGRMFGAKVVSQFRVKERSQ